jgi:hypothetical protein
VNLGARFVALKVRFDDKNAKHYFLPADEVNIPTTILGLLDRAAFGLFSASPVRTIEAPEMAIESYGSIVRAYPLLILPGAEDRYRNTFRGMAEAALRDADLYVRVNALDLTYTAFEGLKNIGRVVSPFECIDLVIPEVLIGGSEIVVVGLQEADSQVMQKLALDYVKNLINSLATCIVELVAGEITNPAGWTAIAINEFMDIVSAAKWVVDVPLFGASDSFTLAPYDRLELERPSVPQLETTTQSLRAGELFTLHTFPAVRAKGANLRVDCRWVPETASGCDPAKVPDLEVIFYAAQWPIDKYLTAGDPDAGVWTYEATTYGDDTLHGDIVQFRIQVSRLSSSGFFTLPPLTPPEGEQPACAGHFQVDARIEYEMAQ